MAGKVSFSLDDKTKEHRLEEFLETINYTYNNGDLTDFISVNKKGFLIIQLLTLIFYKDKKIPRGMKLVKVSLKRIRVLWKIFRITQVVLIQEDKIERHYVSQFILWIF